ncbi:hypothetical protein HDU93_005983 [Gonapodya sp. JEL0774]|nr:hypothetical protein HDU93_005983 [Gonapodya sp. JEL0774]
MTEQPKDDDAPPPYSASAAGPAQLVFRTPRSLLVPPPAPAPVSSTSATLPPLDAAPTPIAPASPEHSDPSKVVAAILSKSLSSFKGKVIPRKILGFAFLGLVEIDLRGGILEPGIVTEIECHAILGKIVIRAPLEFPLEITGMAILGGFKDLRGRWSHKDLYRWPLLQDNTTYPEQPEGASVDVTGYSLLGGVTVLT